MMTCSKTSGGPNRFHPSALAHGEMQLSLQRVAGDQVSSTDRLSRRPIQTGQDDALVLPLRARRQILLGEPFVDVLGFEIADPQEVSDDVLQFLKPLLTVAVSLGDVVFLDPIEVGIGDGGKSDVRVDLLALLGLFLEEVELGLGDLLVSAQAVELAVDGDGVLVVAGGPVERRGTGHGSPPRFTHVVAAHSSLLVYPWKGKKWRLDLEKSRKCDRQDSSLKASCP